MSFLNFHKSYRREQFNFHTLAAHVMPLPSASARPVKRSLSLAVAAREMAAAKLCREEAKKQKLDGQSPSIVVGAAIGNGTSTPNRASMMQYATDTHAGASHRLYACSCRRHIRRQDAGRREESACRHIDQHSANLRGCSAQRRYVLVDWIVPEIKQQCLQVHTITCAREQVQPVAVGSQESTSCRPRRALV